MSELYFTKPYRGSLKTLRLEFGEVKNKYLLKSFEGEDNDKGKREFYPTEEVFDNDQVMLKEVWDTRKRLSEEGWTLTEVEVSEDIHQSEYEEYLRLEQVEEDFQKELKKHYEGLVFVSGRYIDLLQPDALKGIRDYKEEYLRELKEDDIGLERYGKPIDSDD